MSKIKINNIFFDNLVTFSLNVICSSLKNICFSLKNNKIMTNMLEATRRHSIFAYPTKYDYK